MLRKKGKNSLKVTRFFFFFLTFLLFSWGMYKILSSWNELVIKNVIIEGTKRLDKKEFEQYFLGKNILKITNCKSNLTK